MQPPATLREIGRFAWGHRWHAPLILLLPFAGILVHEGAHAVTALAFGAEVVEMQLWPGEGRWGQVSTHWPRSTVGLFWPLLLYTLAPYLLDLALAGGVGLIAWRKERFSFRAASSLLLYGFCAPMADLANALKGWLVNHCWNCDLSHAFGRPTADAYVVSLLLGALIVRGGFLLQRKLYADRALSGMAYLTLAALGLLLVVAALPAWNALLAAFGPSAQ